MHNRINVIAAKRFVNSVGFWIGKVDQRRSKYALPVYRILSIKQ